MVLKRALLRLVPARLRPFLVALGVARLVWRVVRRRREGTDGGRGLSR
ncbi:hypothetical protein RM780_18215 [Streptomyces sp. DSM 44917]|uniref:Uncharacterized protein n=1 Tax=Streptomyces boetiae TaxID=3075541 RepID=A0ABU2LBK8_9ACTN|nr:hypothetical protein [Streptomyces sp. DSM 44917]MDT0308880.1 hypothetical protein [Streptomyces sp. DSM 44917]